VRHRPPLIDVAAGATLAVVLILVAG